METPPNDFTLLRLAIQNLSCAPQAQRRYVQLGMMPRAIGNLRRIADNLDGLIASGELNDQQATMVRDVRDRLEAGLVSEPDFLAESRAAPREFLFGTALETDSWEDLRQTARICFTALAGDTSPFVAINAR
jgi:hypothetical protein